MFARRLNWGVMHHLAAAIMAELMWDSKIQSVVLRAATSGKPELQRPLRGAKLVEWNVKSGRIRLSKAGEVWETNIWNSLYGHTKKVRG